jgi:hypothetical protein
VAVGDASRMSYKVLVRRGEVTLSLPPFLFDPFISRGVWWGGEKEDDDDVDALKNPGNPAAEASVEPVAARNTGRADECDTDDRDEDDESGELEKPSAAHEELEICTATA